MAHAEPELALADVLKDGTFPEYIDGKFLLKNDEIHAIVRGTIKTIESHGSAIKVYLVPSSVSVKVGGHPQPTGEKQYEWPIYPEGMDGKGLEIEIKENGIKVKWKGSKVYAEILRPH